MDNEAVLREISDCYRAYNHKTGEDVRPLYESLNDLGAEIYGDPILFYAAKHADMVGISILLHAGADAALQDKYGRNALHFLAYEDARDYAPWADEAEAARLLLEAGASAIRKNVDGVTCTHIAAERGKLSILQALVRAGKKLDLANKDGETALHLACDRAVRAAESYYKYTKSRYDQAMEETGDGNEYGEKKLAEKRRDLKESCDREWAEVDRRFAVVKCLLDAGLDPDQKDNYGTTPKKIAFDCMDIRVPALLGGTYAEGDELDEGKRLHMLTKGMNLIQAAEKRDYDAVEALLKLGADPDELCGEELRHYGTSLLGKPPLAVACMFPDGRLVSLLLEHGATPSLKDADGKIPMWYCLRAGRDKELADIMKAMVAKGLDINMEADEKGNTLLNTACRSADSASDSICPFIAYLLRGKADPNIAGNSGVTPLMAVCGGRSGYMEDIQVSLLEAGAEVSARDSDGSTPLMYAAQNRSHAAAKAMADMLFAFGDPKPDAANNEGETALALASKQDNENLVNFLLMKQ